MTLRTSTITVLSTVSHLVCHDYPLYIGRSPYSQDMILCLKIDLGADDYRWEVQSVFHTHQSQRS